MPRDRPIVQALGSELGNYKGNIERLRTGCVEDEAQLKVIGPRQLR